MSIFKRVIERNEKAWNKSWEIDPILELDMIIEEVKELADAMDDVNAIQVVDALVDIMYVCIWTMHKLWLREETMKSVFHEVCDSNDTKHPFVKDKNWKVKKNPNTRKPNISDLVDVVRLQKNLFISSKL